LREYISASQFVPFAGLLRAYYTIVLESLYAWRFDQPSAIMTTATLSPKLQIVIPSAMRKALKLVPGEKFHVMSFEGRIEFIVERPTASLRGFLPGLNAEVVREPDRF